MVAYEILLILDAELAEPRQKEIVDRVKTLVETGGGSWQQHVPWGKRRLAYEIAHKEEGIYHLVTFDAEPATVEEIGRVLKIDDNVMRHMAVRRVEGSSTAAPAAYEREPAAAPSGRGGPRGSSAPSAPPAAAAPAPTPAAEPETAPEPEEPAAEAEPVVEAEPAESVQAPE